MRTRIHRCTIQCCFWLTLYGFAAPRIAQADNYQYCIIVDDDLADILHPLADWKNEKGVSTTIATTGWIEQNYSGRDRAEKIRNFIAEKVAEWPDFEYLLLAGDVGTIPPRYVWCGGLWSIGAVLVPSDDYYTLLSTNWDTDHDNLFGEEYSSLTKTDEIDFYDYSLYVGRLPSDDRMEMTTMVDKIIAYEKEPPEGSWKKRIIFCAAIFDPSNSTDCIQSSEWLYQTHFPQNMGFQRYNLYESVARDFDDLTAENFMLILNRGASIINNISHGEIENFYWYKQDGNDWTPGDYITTVHAESAENGFKLHMVMACACATAHFDHDAKCLGEAFMTAPNGGAIIYFGSTRYNLGQMYFFYEDIFGQADQRAGVAWQMAKNKMLKESIDPFWRFSYLQAIMFGDPELQIRFSDVTHVEAETYRLPASIAVFPNPFNASTTISFDLPKSGSVNVTVYNIFGQEAETLVDAHYAAGRHRVLWNAADKAGGLYFCRIRSERFSRVHKLILVK